MFFVRSPRDTAISSQVRLRPDRAHTLHDSRDIGAVAAASMSSLQKRQSAPDVISEEPGNVRVPGWLKSLAPPQLLRSASLIVSPRSKEADEHDASETSSDDDVWESEEPNWLSTAGEDLKNDGFKPQERRRVSLVASAEPSWLQDAADRVSMRQEESDEEEEKDAKPAARVHWAAEILAQAPAPAAAIDFPGTLPPPAPAPSAAPPPAAAAEAPMATTTTTTSTVPDEEPSPLAAFFDALQRWLEDPSLDACSCRLPAQKQQERSQRQEQQRDLGHADFV